MRNLLLVLALVFTVSLSYAQQDSTLIEKELEELENSNDPENGIKELEEKKEVLEKELEAMELESVVEGLSKTKKEELEKKMKETEKKIAAIEKGIKEMEKQFPENDKDNEDDFDFDWDGFGDFDFWPFLKKDKFNGHWAGFELGLTNFVNVDNKFELPEGGEFLELDAAKSWSYSLNVLEFNIPLHKKYFGIVTGVGFDWKRYHFEKNESLEYDVEGNITSVEAGSPLSENKLNVNSVTVPLLIELQVPVGRKDKRLHISGGVIGSMRTGSKLQQAWEDDESHYEMSRRSDFGLSTFKYAYTLRVGYHDFQIFANYEPISLFEDGKGPEVYPISIGFRLLNF